MNRLANILIAGSERNGTDRLCDLLSENNCNALVCKDFDELKREASVGRPDLIVVEVDGEKKEHFALAEALKADAELSTLPAFGWHPAKISEPSQFFSRASEADFQDLFLGPLEGDEMLFRFRPLMRFSTQVAELRRRTKLAREFGLDIAKTPDLSTDTGNYTILVASCETDHLACIEAAMDGAAAKIEECGSLFEARDLLFDGQYDAAVVSISSPDEIEGVFEFCEEVRNNPRLFNLPIVVLAGSDLSLDPLDALTHGASRFIQAPVCIEELRFSLRSLADLQRKRWRIHSMIQKTKSDATCDPETGSYNPDFQRAHLDRLTDEAREWQRHVTVLFFSLGVAVEALSEEFGPKPAGELYVQVAHWIEKLVRLEDLTARYGERELCVALPDTPLDVAETVMRRVSGILNYTDFAIPDVYRPVRISVAVGAAELEADDDPAALIARAHENLE